MSAKNRDEHNRWRNITVGFRVSPEENDLINKAVALSGLPKQEYCYRRCLNRDVVVQGNPRVYKALKNELAAVLQELQRIEAGGDVNDELLNIIELIADILGGLKGEDNNTKTLETHRINIRQQDPTTKLWSLCEISSFISNGGANIM